MEIGRSGIQIDLQNLLAIYAYANTPSYLYRRMRADQSLINLARSIDPKELIQLYNDHIKKDQRPIEDTVIGYSLLVTITLLNNHKLASSLLQEINPKLLEWGERIRQIYESEATPNSIQIIQIPFEPPQINKESKTETSTTIKTIPLGTS